MMKTDIHKIKTDRQAWNRLYDRLDKDHLLVEDHRMPKIPQDVGTLWHCSGDGGRFGFLVLCIGDSVKKRNYLTL